MRLMDSAARRGVVTSMMGFTMLAAVATAARADVQPHAGMLRYPDIGPTHIAFVYANDIWLVPREGGTAIPLASPPGQELFPKFSPDGKTIAFVGNYDGNRDLYTITVDGGVPTRVTHHPDGETLCDWTPAGNLLFYTNGLAGLRRQMQLFTVAANGGLPVKVAVPYGATGSISPDGEWLAYTPHTTDFRTWKRYRGGMATDVWLFHLREHTSRRMTDWEGTDTLPMWHNQTVYYLSDSGPEHHLNLWAFDTASGRREQVTTYQDFDVKWPSIGPGKAGEGEIVFQLGASLYVLDLKSRQAGAIEVSVPGDRPKVRPRSFDVGKLIASTNVSPTGKRAVLEARGDIWTLPAEKGSPRNMTRTGGAAERDPAWSPDGRWIAYFSDATGEYELYVMPADGKDKPRQLTSGTQTFHYNPTWSPDSKRIAFTDKAGNISVHTIDSSETWPADTDPYANQPRLNWSHDSNWLTYAKSGENRQSAIWLFSAATKEKHKVTSGMFNDNQPTFDRKGDYLFFTSNRDFTKPAYEDVGTTFVYQNTDVLLAVPLRKDLASPFAPKSDEETPASQPADSASASTAQPATQPSATQAATQPAETKPLVIDLDGFERRAVPVPVKKGGVANLNVTHEGKLVYTRNVPSGGDGEPSIKLFDPADEKREEKTVVADAGAFQISADGKKLLVRKGETMAIVDAAPDQKLDKPVPQSGLTAVIDPREEWRQLFNDVWRVQRDFFYDPKMHGVDWPGMRDRYGKMLVDCVSREDVSYVVSEMIAELNVGHAYYFGGDVENPPSVTVGMLGCDFELHDGAYRIARILEGASWDSDARGPLSQPGVKAAAGDYLLAVNGVPVDTSKDPWAAFVALADRVVTITLSSKPKMDSEARDLTVQLLASDADLHYRAWIERNRSYVADKTDGSVGYVYVPNTGVDGQNNLFRQFYGQVDKQALIIDERWNGGGQIPTRFIELLNRPITNYWARRDGSDWPWPPDSHQGPKCMLINGLAGSGGDAFPAYFRKAGLGKLIGMRTWGGLVGISGNPALVDGGSTTAPTFAYYDPDGTWGIEGHGVDPDLEVIDDPALMVNGADPQLDAAIGLMLEEVKANGYRPPKRPEYVDRSGMGIREEDK